MERALLSPPALILILAAAVSVLAAWWSRYEERPSRRSTTKPYACGEDAFDALAQPDYGGFLAFAFFFTIAHVTVMMLAMQPAVVCCAGGLYLTGALVAFSVLFRKE